MRGMPLLKISRYYNGLKVASNNVDDFIRETHLYNQLQCLVLPA